MKASMAITLLVYVCMGVATQAAAASLECEACEGKSPPKKKSPPKPPSPKTPKTPSPTLKPPSSSPTCSIDYRKLKTCAPLALGGTLGVGSQCCGLLGIVGVNPAVCLCLALNAKVLGVIDVNVGKVTTINTILLSCSRRVPNNIVCP